MNHLKYQYVVHPGADPGGIHVACRGAERVFVDDAGRLQIDTPLGPVWDERPAAWQTLDGRNEPVAASYRLEAGAAGGDATYGFDIGAYDGSRPLVIDPDMIVYCGDIGARI